MHTHLFQLGVIWTGNLGTGTSAYDAYSRNHTIRCEGKSDLHASSDPYFRGEKEKYNPEDLLLASISSCHMLWYLHLCADAGIVVVNYEDKPQGRMITGAEVRGKFTEVVLHPHVTITDASRVEEANALHHKAHEKCFISNSCNFPILCEGECEADA